MAAGLSGEALVAAVERIEDAQTSTRHPPDSALEKRRTWDRDYRRKKRGVHPTSTRHPPDPPESANHASTKKDSISLERQRGSRCPPDYQPDELRRKFAADLGHDAQSIDTETVKFRNHWIAKPGKDGCKLDWDRTWENWMLNAKRPNGKKSGTFDDGSWKRPWGTPKA